MLITDASGLVRLTAPTASSAAVGQNHCFSIYVKQKNSTAGAVNTGIYNSGQSQGTEPAFLIQSNFAKAASYSFADVQDIGNGWYRLYVYWSATGTSSFSCFFDIESSPGGGTKVVGEGLYLWGPQLEVGTFPSVFFQVGTKFWPDMTGLNVPVLVNGPSYTGASGGLVMFDPIDDRITLSTPTYSTWSTNVWLKSVLYTSPPANQTIFSFVPSAGSSAMGNFSSLLILFYNVSSITIGPSGGIYVGGQFAGAQDITRGAVLVLNDDGTLNTGFDIGFNTFSSIASTSVEAFTFDSSGGLYISGVNFGYMGTRKINQSTGSYISQPKLASGGGSTTITNGGVLLDEATGKMWMYGHWATTYDSVSRQHITKANISDYSVDTTFNSATGFNNNEITSAFLDSSKNLYLGGNFTQYKGATASRIIKINGTDASIDNTFSSGTGFNAVVHKIARQSDGKIIVCGNFTSYNGTSINRMIRLNTDGTIDNTFNIGTGFNSVIFAFEIQPDGKIVAVGNFTSFNGTSINRIIRLNSDGSIDTGFSVGTGLGLYGSAVKVQSNGKILIGLNGQSTYNGTTVTGIFRINSDGSIDTGFNIGSGINLALYRDSSEGRLFGSAYQFFGSGLFSGNAQRQPSALVFPFFQNNFRMYTVTFNSTTKTIKFYADGVLTGQTTTTGSAAMDMQQANLYFWGYLGSYYLYNRELSSTEILSLYRSTKNRFGR
jgi:uncharacterized delta-60 repeat protein